MIVERAKWILFPGINLHTRDRFRAVPKHFGRGDRTRLVLDAGSGNGMNSWQAWRLGNRVLGVTFKEREAAGSRRLFNEYLGIPESELSFRVMNLKEADRLKEEFGPFDEIVCTEVIEHIRDDKGVCEAFFRLLKPGGCVHITAPNAEHPYNAAFPLDEHETGGHVRAGYTERTYRELLEPIGFRVEASEGLGGRLRQGFNWRIKVVQEKFGAWAGVPLFFLAMPFMPFDEKIPRAPYSLYVRARKPSA